MPGAPGEVVGSYYFFFCLGRFHTLPGTSPGSSGFFSPTKTGSATPSRRLAS